MARMNHEGAFAKQRAQRFLTPSGRQMANELDDRDAKMRAYHAKKRRRTIDGFNNLPREKQIEIESRERRRMQLSAHKSHHKSDNVSLAPLKFLEKPVVD